MIEDYLKNNPYDELYPLLLECGFKVPAYQPFGRQRYEPHHLFGGNPKWDLKSNVVSVSPATHDWCHNHQNQAEWRIVGLAVKLRKRELSQEEFRTATGKNLAGWLIIHEPSTDSPVRGLWEELSNWSDSHD